MTALLDAFAFPPEAYLNKFIPKKLISENTDLDITDKKALRDDIDKIRLVYALKPATVNIEAYRDDIREYDEVAVIQIDLSSPNCAQRIANFINKAIPYPIILIFSFSDTIAISVADKRINQANKSKWVLEDIWFTQWFNPDAPNEIQKKFMQDLAFKNLSFVNFYAFYTDIKDRIIALNVAQRSGKYTITTGEDTNSRATAMHKLEQLEQEKSELQNKLSNQKQMGRQIDIATKIKKIADQINDIQGGL